MKKLYTFLIAALIAVNIFAQAPNMLSYQAVIRNSSNQLVTGKTVGMRVSILQGSSTGTPVYIETQTPTTNSNGLITIRIGGGTVVSGDFAAINWAEQTYYLKTETDPNGGTNYTITGASQMLSVPYALYAKKAGNGFSGSYNDLSDKPTLFDGNYNSLSNKPRFVVSKIGDTLTLGDGNWVIIPGISIANSKTIDYKNGNEAYWEESTKGFRDVVIGGGSNVYKYDTKNQQYISGNSILIPNKISKPNGDFVDKSNFFGFNGSTPSHSNYQWDSISNAVVSQPSIFDQTKMFVSPLSANKMNYTKVLQYNSNLAFTSSSNSTIVIDGPDSSLAYPLKTPRSGSYNIWNGEELVNGGNLKNSNYTFSGSNIEYFSQQQLDSTTNCSYCVATYGKGWRLPTDIEVGHKTNQYLHSTPTIIDLGYQTATNYEIFTSTKFHYPSYPFYKWYVVTKDGNWNNSDQWSKLNYHVRCVYAGRPKR